jgi:iron complex transport system substrate-binding protein
MTPLLTLVSFFTFLSLVFGASDVNGPTLHYAQMVTVQHKEQFTELHFYDGAQLCLYRSKNGSVCPSGMPALSVPVHSLVTLSANHLALLKQLDMLNLVVGHAQKKLTYIPLAAQVKELGYPPNPELVLSLGPQIMMANGGPAMELEGLVRLKKFGLPVFPCLDYGEKTPLARAEWLKIVALLAAREKEAQFIFQMIEKQYQIVKRLYAPSLRPKVIVGHLQAGVWNAPPGDSDLAQLIQDAGGDYIWKDEKKPVRKSLEEIVSLAQEDWVWLPQSLWQSLDDARQEDHRYTLLKFFRPGKVFNNNRRLTPAGGNDYWEMGLLRPDLLLKDLVTMFHLPQKQNLLEWYRPLN